MSSENTLLDNPAFVTNRDPKGMYALAVGFPEQCRAALRIAETTPISLDADGGATGGAHRARRIGGRGRLCPGALRGPGEGAVQREP